MDREQQFATLTRMLARYEPGDVVLHSDLMDSLMGLEDYFLASQVCLDFLAWMHGWMRDNLKQTTDPQFADRLGQALALLQKWKPTLNVASKERVEAEMQQFYAEKPLMDASVPLLDEFGDGGTPASPLPAGNANDVFRSQETFAIFVAEAKERLSQAQELVLVLETQPDDSESLAALFRVFHTIKGESGFLHLVHLGELTHGLENILDLLRNQKLEMNRILVDVLLAGIDRSSQIIQDLEAGGQNTAVDTGLAAFLEELKALASQGQPHLGAVLIQGGQLEKKDVEDILAKQRSGVFNQRFGEIAVKENFISDQDLKR